MHNALANAKLVSAGLVGPLALVADDDPASCRFLCDGLRSLGVRVEPYMDGKMALERARAQAFDMLLLDCRMPGAGAMQILVELRESARAQSVDSVAIATTAELGLGDREKLMAVGFSEILLKPCSLTDLRRVLEMAVSEPPVGDVLDDGAGLTASGDNTTMRALRLLLREELIALDLELDPLSKDPAALGERLHRLRSSCGFCGAAALAAQTKGLQQQLARAGSTQVALARFRKSLSSTLQALNG